MPEPSLASQKRESPAAPTQPMAWTFAGARLDERTLELKVGGRLVALERKPLEVLRTLLRRAGDVVSHDDLLDAVWPGRILSDSVLKKCVSQVRDALRDTDQGIVKTVHGYGYRLVAPVEVEPLGPSLLLSPGLRADGSPDTRQGAALIVDIAGTVELRNQVGDAPAGERIRKLVDAIVRLAKDGGGAFIKSYGDDVLAVFERDPVTSAANVAIAAHRTALQSGFQVYAGLHAGDIEFRQYMGHPDAVGLTVNIAARLHKLTDGAPGRIFLAEESVATLSPELKARATAYGPRELKGLGTLNVWTIDWHDAKTTAGTVFAEEAADTSTGAGPLVLRHGEETVRLEESARPFFVGRGKECVLRLSDPEPRISSKHLMFEKIGGRWVIQDISRNGTHLRDARTGEALVLPYCTKAMAPQSGRLCLGRPFADDPDGLYTIEFEIV